VSSVVVSQDTLATRCEGAVLLWNATSKGGNSGSYGSVDGGGGSGSGASGSSASDATKAEAEVEAEVEALAAAAPESRQQIFDVVGPSTAPYLSLVLELCTLCRHLCALAALKVPPYLCKIPSKPTNQGPGNRPNNCSGPPSSMSRKSSERSRRYPSTVTLQHCNTIALNCIVYVYIITSIG
jgi:hypothetical protein